MFVNRTLFLFIVCVKLLAASFAQMELKNKPCNGFEYFVYSEITLTIYKLISIRFDYQLFEYLQKTNNRKFFHSSRLTPRQSEYNNYWLE